jgi:MoaA/NifB/PqqE/SkfB family radical SAM enzyme
MRVLDHRRVYQGDLTPSPCIPMYSAASATSGQYYHQLKGWVWEEGAAVETLMSTTATSGSIGGASRHTHTTGSNPLNAVKYTYNVYATGKSCKRYSQSNPSPWLAAGGFFFFVKSGKGIFGLACT